MCLFEWTGIWRPRLDLLSREKGWRWREAAPSTLWWNSSNSIDTTKTFWAKSFEPSIDRDWNKIWSMWKHSQGILFYFIFWRDFFFFFSQFICRAVETVTVDVGAKVEQEALKVISALECPRHEFKESRKTFVLDSTAKSLHGSAADQAAMFRHRFELVRQRVMRHPMFTTHKLTTVKSLLGATGLISVCTRWSQLLFGFHSFFRSKDCFWFADAKQHGAIDFGGSEQYGSIGHDKLQAGRRTVHGPLLGAGRRRIASEQLVFRVCHVDATNWGGPNNAGNIPKCGLVWRSPRAAAERRGRNVSKRCPRCNDGCDQRSMVGQAWMHGQLGEAFWRIQGYCSNSVYLSG